MYGKAKHEHYMRNRQRYIADAKERRLSFFYFLRWIKEGQPCHDCGVVYNPWQMHFDHTDDDKIANVSALATKGNIDKLIEEIKKCDLVCANCHANRTHNRSSALSTAELVQRVPNPMGVRSNRTGQATRSYSSAE